MKYHNRYPAIQKGPDGKKLCRGCGAEVPKGRQTWCSTECYRRYCPREVIAAVRERDKGICQICRKPTQAQKFYGQSNWEEWRQYRNSLSRAEYDHIIPMAEGGLTVLENMRTLCVGCHKTRTAEWRKSKAKGVLIAQSI